MRALRSSRVVALVISALTAVSVAGCAGGRNTLNTPSSACFRAIGVADKAAGPHGEFLGVRETSSTHARRLYPGDTPAGRRVCLVGYDERNRPGVIVVVVDVRGRHVVGVHRSARPPVRFQHL
jgi:hypothetical protein